MAIERHLILVHTPGDQDVRDFEDIGRKVQALAPDIEVFIATNDLPCSVTRRRAARLPTLIFSPGYLMQFRPLRGKLYAGAPIPKLEQIARLKAAGLSVPASAEIVPDIVLSKAAFGSHVVVKPGHSLASHGKDMTLMRRETVRYRSRDAYPEGHPGRHGPMYAQQFIDTGPFVNHYRVVTLFGEPLLAFKTVSQVARPPLDAPDEVLAAMTVKATRKGGLGITRQLEAQADILAMARRTYDALPEIPLQAVDIVKAADTGKLFVLEANPGGNTWIFSKGAPTAHLEEALGVARLADQFDAFTVAARVLVERTRREAV